MLVSVLNEKDSTRFVQLTIRLEYCLAGKKWFVNGKKWVLKVP